MFKLYCSFQACRTLSKAKLMIHVVKNQIKCILLNEWECTVVTMAHRPDTIMDYDNVVVLERGQVVEFDEPRALLRKEKGSFWTCTKAITWMFDNKILVSELWLFVTATFARIRCLSVGRQKISSCVQHSLICEIFLQRVRKIRVKT